MFVVRRSRVDHRVQQLTSVLVHELKISPERSIKGGRRSARRAVAQLIRLGKSIQVTTSPSAAVWVRAGRGQSLGLTVPFRLFNPNPQRKCCASATQWRIKKF